MLSEITRGALDPEGWQPLIDARPDWFEVIPPLRHQERLGAAQAIVTHEDSVARHQHFVDRIAPAARNIHAYWLARRAPQERPRRPVQKASAPGRNDHARADPARSSSAATGRRTHCTELLQPEDPLCYPCPSSGASTRSQRPPFFRPFQFFDHTRLNHGALCIFAVQLVLIRSEPGICQLAHRWSANQFPTKGLSSRTRWCPLRKLRESEKLQSAVGASYERMRLRGLKRCDQHFIAPQ
jgi:hypothetical protein